MIALPTAVETIRVLLVEDDKDVNNFLTTLLMTKKIMIHEKRAGIEDAIKRFDPHVIILDYLLSDGDALGILRDIRPYIKLSIPVIFTAIKIPDPIKTQLYISGAMNIIQKPCSICTLESVIENYYEVSLKYRS